ncbi:ATP-dependent DNA ligase [Streptomyces sp. NPDC031705]|uniref:ATP-dependent DNA ligase n=1 Tax=Streptomyces sp. NPDC031705 TaxID=3155729 RepID=UPI0033FFF7EC
MQRRAAARARSAPALVARWPALYVAFDVLQADGTDLTALPYAERRRRLEVLFAARALTSPWTLCPMTTDMAMAADWLDSWTDVAGLEGVVAKPMGAPYQSGRRAWTKIKRRDTTETIVGAITGKLARPQLLALGCYDHEGRLRTVGRTVTLRPEQGRHLAEHLTVPAPGHPWEGVQFAASWGSRDVLDVTLVRPDLVAEISADRAIDRGGVFRHPLRFKRLRLDVTPVDVPGFGVGFGASRRLTALTRCGAGLGAG